MHSVKKQISSGTTVLEYYQKGDRPKLLIHSGVHGDEYSVIPLVQKMVEKYELVLPDFIFVPIVSPSAVKQRTRKNADGLDLNRSFLAGAKSSEVLANMALVLPFHFDLLVSIHEDVEYDSFYIYDSDYSKKPEETRVFCQDLERQGIKLFSGIDDLNDPVHGYTVVNGQVIWGIEYDEPDNGTFDDWAIKAGIIKRLFMPEVPTSLSAQKKELIVENIFTKLMIPFTLAE